eukprot:IDg3428t1
MSGFELGAAILKGISSTAKIIRSVKTHVEADKRATKLARNAQRKIRRINTTISEYRTDIDECKKLHSIMLKCNSDLLIVNQELSKLYIQVSRKVAPLRVAEAKSTSETLDRIITHLEHLETRIDTCCMTAASMNTHKLDNENT